MQSTACREHLQSREVGGWSFTFLLTIKYWLEGEARRKGAPHRPEPAGQISSGRMTHIGAGRAHSRCFHSKLDPDPHKGGAASGASWGTRAESLHTPMLHLASAHFQLPSTSTIGSTITPQSATSPGKTTHKSAENQRATRYLSLKRFIGDYLQSQCTRKAAVWCQRLMEVVAV